ncbi:unnamed protein product [Citrullus colocynthis]|uniref:Uncharacterized protein n=1 Tax=Citrullus colocynthis TaxID=252529 RepID=A0ABP0YW64_9ROSI
MVGCLGNLYQSVETLNQNYLQPDNNTDTLLKPKLVSFCSSTTLLPSFSTEPSPLPKYYKCINSNCSYCNCRIDGNFDDPKPLCPLCKEPMTPKFRYAKAPSGSTNTNISTTNYEEQGGYVKGVVTYMVMDDLSIKPMSTISTITLLNNFNIKEVGALEERIITLDVNRHFEYVFSVGWLLRASLQSKTVLTDVFLGNETL